MQDHATLGALVEHAEALYHDARFGSVREWKEQEPGRKAVSTVLMTGGLAADSGLRAAIQETLRDANKDFDVRAHEDSILAGAIGAALWGAYRHGVLVQRGDLNRGAAAPAREAHV